MNETCAKCGKTKEEHFEDHGGSHRVRFWCHAQGELDGWQFTPPANSDLITSAGPCLNNPNQPTTPVQAAGECPACGGTGLTGIIADDGSGVKEPCPSCRYGFGPEIKSQAAQAEPALPRKAQVSQETEECKVGAAPSEIPLKEWLAVQDAYKEAYEKSRTPIKEWTYRGSLVSADFILCRFGKTVAVVPDAAVVRELVDSLNNLQSLQAQLDAARAELKQHQDFHGAICLPNEVPISYNELRQKLAEAEKAVLLSIQNYKEAIHERDRLHHDALGYLAKYTCTPEEGYLKAPQCLSQDIDRVGTERDSLRAQVETLKGALRPFAEAFDPKLAGWYFNMERLRSAKSVMEGI